jgi:SPP1 family predicted phage head-tail adaptor
MKAGQLDRPILIESRGTSRNSIGETISTWGVWAKCFARFEPQSGGESFEATQRTASQVAKFTIRYRAGMTPQMRIKYDGRAWDILDIASPDRRVSLVITAVCREVGSGFETPGG